MQKLVRGNTLFKVSSEFKPLPHKKPINSKNYFKYYNTT